MQKIAQIIPETLKQRLTTGAEIALLDVREYGEYGEGHPIFAVNLPYSRLEAKAAQLLPCRSAPCVLLDNGDGVAEKRLVGSEIWGTPTWRFWTGGPLHGKPQGSRSTKA